MATDKLPSELGIFNKIDEIDVLELFKDKDIIEWDDDGQMIIFKNDHVVDTEISLTDN